MRISKRICTLFVAQILVYASKMTKIDNTATTISVGIIAGPTQDPYGSQRQV